MKFNSVLIPLCSLALAIPAVTTANAKVGALNPLKDEGTVLSDKNVVANHFKKNLANLDTAPTIGSSFGIQVSDLSSGKRSVRFIAEISTLSCEAAFSRTISSLGSDNAVSDDDEVYKATSSIACTVAYTSVINGATTYTPADGHYLVVYTMKNVPEAYWSYYFDLSLTLTYLDADGVEQTVTSSSHKANIYGGLYASSFKNSTDTCVAYEDSSVTSSTTSTTVLQRDPNYPAVVVKTTSSSTSTSSVKAMTFGSDVTSIAAVAFSEQTGSETATNGTGSDYANYESPYSELESVDFANTSISIGNYAFAGCDNLTEVSFPLNSNGLPTCGAIGYGAFAGTGITYAEIPDSTTIEAYAFGGCPNLKEVVIHNECLCNNELADNPVLEKVTFAEDINLATNSGLKTIGYEQWISGLAGITDSKTGNDINAFHNCPSLKEVYVYCKAKADWAGGNQNIWRYMFNNITALETFVATSETYISPNMFAGCTGLKNITITTNILGVKATAFEDCGATLTINFDGTLAEFEAKCDDDWYDGANITVVASDATETYTGISA